MTNYEQVKRWRKANREKVNAQARRYRARHPNQIKLIKQKHRDNNLESIQRKDREKHSSPEYKAQQKIRNAKFSDKKRRGKELLAGKPKPSHCELCGTKEFEENVGRIVFDHNHSTGNFRGWICDRCNKVLGLVYDQTELLRSMANYLEANNV